MNSIKLNLHPEARRATYFLSPALPTSRVQELLSDMDTEAENALNALKALREAGV